MTAQSPFPAITSFSLGELTVTRTGAGSTVAGPGAGDVALPADPDAIREFVAEDAAGRYRPLAGERSLRPGWHADCRDDVELVTVIDAIYPLAPVHLEQWRGGTLRIVSLADVLARQTARYAVSNDLSSAGRDAAADALCSRCVKHPLWRHPEAAPAPDSATQVVPCPEPCSVLVSLCREAALWEKQMPPASPVDPAAPFADFEAPGNEVREDCLVRMAATREPHNG